MLKSSLESVLASRPSAISASGTTSSAPSSRFVRPLLTYFGQQVVEVLHGLGLLGDDRVVVVEHRDPVVLDHVVLARRVVLRLEELGVEVLLVRQQRVVHLQQLVGLDQLRDGVLARRDDVVRRATGVELGEQLVVRRVVGLVDLQARLRHVGQRRELLVRRRVVVLRPVEDLEVVLERLAGQRVGARRWSSPVPSLPVDVLPHGAQQHQPAEPQRRAPRQRVPDARRTTSRWSRSIFGFVSMGARRFRWSRVGHGCHVVTSVVVLLRLVRPAAPVRSGPTGS